jgi:5-methylcytosine-specific restriction enzyme A
VPGCNVLGDGGRCEEHRVQAQRLSDQRRESSSKRGYGSRWQKARSGWLRSHPLCGDRQDGPSGQHSLCAREDKVTVGTDVDHIDPVDRPSDEKFWTPANWQTLCHECHSTKTSREDGGFGRDSR